MGEYYRSVMWRLCLRDLCVVLSFLLLCGGTWAQSSANPGNSHHGSQSEPVRTFDGAPKDESCSTAGAVEGEVTARLKDKTLEVVSKRVEDSAHCVEVALPLPGRVVIVKDGVALVSLIPKGLMMIGVTDPIRPRIDGIVHPELAIASMREVGGTLWLVDANNVIVKNSLRELSQTKAMSSVNAKDIGATESKESLRPSQNQKEDSKLITEAVLSRSPSDGTFRVVDNTLLILPNREGPSGNSAIKVAFDGSIYSVLRIGSELYIVHRNNLITILDVSNPMVPVKSGLVGTHGIITRLSVGATEGTLLVEQQGGKARTYTIAELKNLARTAERVEMPHNGLTTQDADLKSESTIHKYQTSYELTGGGAYIWLLVDSIFAGCTSISIQKNSSRYVFGGRFSGCVGRTLVGLITVPLSAGFSFDVIARPWLRLGLSLTSGALVLERATGGAFGFASIGLSVEAKFDLYRPVRWPTPFLLIRSGADLLPSASTAAPVITLGLGLRMPNLLSNI